MRGFLAPTLLLMLLALPARASVDRTPVPCPVDENEVEITILLSTDSLLGHDRDLCPHASGDDEVRNAVSSCPKCGFSGTAIEFRDEIDPEVAARIKLELSPAPAVTAWERYAARARILEWQGASAPRVGESWLRAAWSIRLEERRIGDDKLASSAVRVLALANPDGQAKTTLPRDPILDPALKLDALLATKALPDADRAVAYFLSASGWRARGELAAAEERYAAAIAAGGEHAKAIEGAVARDRASMALERGYLTHALAHFRAGLAAGEKVPQSQRAMLAFLTAECARRLESWEEAQRWYRAAEALGEKAQPEVKPLIRRGLDDVKAAQKKKPKKK